MKIFFVCTGNTCRSPMAEYIFAEEAKKRNLDCECRSAGIVTYTGSPASDNSVAVLKEIGIDLSKFRSTSIKAIFFESFDLYVPMEYFHEMALKEYGIPSNKIYHLSKNIADPYGKSIEYYRYTRDDIINEMKILADYIEEQSHAE